MFHLLLDPLHHLFYITTTWLPTTWPNPSTVLHLNIFPGFIVNQQVIRRDNVIRTRVMSLPSLLDQQDLIDVCAVEAIPDDWRKPIMQYLDNPNGKHDRKTRVHATNYVMYQNELYRKGDDSLLLLCLGPQESAQAIIEVHEGVCGAH
ncbi:hypothetical protein ACFX1X_013696 [Malus domestica]